MSREISTENGGYAMSQEKWNSRGQVHLFEKFGKKFVVDGGSGIATEVDDVAWTILSSMAGDASAAEAFGVAALHHGRETALSAMDELGELYDANELFSLDERRTPRKGGRLSPSSLCLMVAEDCNLRCDYCFAGGSGYNSRHRLMSERVGRRAVDFLIDNSGSKEMSISFFGGEPLINFPTLVLIAGYARERASAEQRIVRFNITTNATVMNREIVDFLATSPDINLILSIDGDERRNNTHRKFSDGRGSYDIVSRNIRTLFDSGIAKERISFRGTFTARTCSDFSEAVSELLAHRSVPISVEPAIVEMEDLRITEEHVPAIKREYDRLASLYLESIKRGEGFSFFHFDMAVANIASLTPIYRPCGAGAGYLAVAGDGTLYPCHRFVGDDAFAMGDVFGGISSDAVFEEFASMDVSKKDACPTCWARYHCGGGCHRHALTSGGSLYSQFELECLLLKHRIELCTYIYSELTSSTEDLVRERFETSVSARPELGVLGSP